MDLESTGQLGSPVLPTDMNMLQVKPLRPFAAGEMCAFKEALTPAEAAAAAAHRRAGTADSKHCRPSQDGKYETITFLHLSYCQKCTLALTPAQAAAAAAHCWLVLKTVSIAIWDKGTPGSPAIKSSAPDHASIHTSASVADTRYKYLIFLQAFATCSGVYGIRTALWQSGQGCLRQARHSYILLAIVSVQLRDMLSTDVYTS